MEKQTLKEIFTKYEKEIIDFAQKTIQIKSFSDKEGKLATLLVEHMRKLGYDEVYLDSVGNVVGKIGSGKKILHFDSHMDTVEVNDEENWTHPPFGGIVSEGYLWGRGSVDMKSALCATIYATVIAKELGYLNNKTVYVTGSVCEEYCDGESLKIFYEQKNIRPDCCIICEPSNNVITLGHKGKAQIRIKTRGVSAHGSAPEKGVNAVYEMAEIIQRVDELNRSLYRDKGYYGTVVLSDISCVSVSLNAVPSECSIYLDRRLAFGETLEQVKKEMESIISGKNASWEVGTLFHTTWNGKSLVYEPMHNPWRIEEDSALTRSLKKAYETVYQEIPSNFDFWDFGTNAVTPVAMGIPTIGFGPGEYKLAHMRDERCAIKEIIDACKVYVELINEF